MDRAALAIIAVLTAAPTQARTLILCTATGQRDVTISVHDYTFKGKSLNCISGDFISRMTPCAPTGGYGLSADVKGAPLSDVAMDWQDYGSHSGGIVSSDVSSQSIDFVGGLLDSGKFKLEWSFSMSLLTGKGELTFGHQAPVFYGCSERAGRSGLASGARQ